MLQRTFHFTEVFYNLNLLFCFKNYIFIFTVYKFFTLEMALISAVIITYNEEDNIERCIKSVLAVADEVVEHDPALETEQIFGWQLQPTERFNDTLEANQSLTLVFPVLPQTQQLTAIDLMEALDDVARHDAVIALDDVNRLGHLDEMDRRYRQLDGSSQSHAQVFIDGAWLEFHQPRVWLDDVRGWCASDAVIKPVSACVIAQTKFVLCPRQ